MVGISLYFSAEEKLKKIAAWHYWVSIVNAELDAVWGSGGGGPRPLDPKNVVLDPPLQIVMLFLRTSSENWMKITDQTAHRSGKDTGKQWKISKFRNEKQILAINDFKYDLSNPTGPCRFPMAAFQRNLHMSKETGCCRNIWHLPKSIDICRSFALCSDWAELFSVWPHSVSLGMERRTTVEYVDRLEFPPKPSGDLPIRIDKRCIADSR